MQPVTTITGTAVPIDVRNLDTNQLCPTRFNKVPVTDPDYQRILFNNHRFAADGTPDPDFILNRPPYTTATILVADANFGCGSSRESAVYALAAFGIRCVIAPSFGDIFFSNCTKNGLLPVVLPADICDTARAALHAEQGAQLSVDLRTSTVLLPDGSRHAFELHPSVRHRLLEGLDDVGVTLRLGDTIAAFEARYQPTMPWLYDQPPDAVGTDPC